MAKAVVKWIEGKKFLGVDSTNHSVVLSTPDEGIGMKPSELMLVALGACSSVDVIGILEKRKVKLTKYEVQISAEQAADPPWTFEKIHLKYILGGQGLNEKDVAKAIELSEGKYCSVAATLKGKAQITTEFVIEPEDA
ncbi:MAG: OsmC family protein [Chloroflexi bacterium]|nr:OsmC family protein [Chloroflexota bacterium]